MEDLTGKIADILSDPEMMNTIKGLSGLLGSSESEHSDESDCSEEKKDSDDSTSTEESPFPFELMQMMLKVMPILSSMKQEDKYTNFLRALRPLLSEARRKKLDSSSQILQIIKILPLLKNQGIL